MWLLPTRRAPAPARVLEATPQQIIATGAAGGGYRYDPVDSDVGYRRTGTGSRPVPEWTLETSRIQSVASYRSNPMARAIVDTYTAFCVGDSGVSYQCTNAQVAAVVDRFWNNPRVRLGQLQDRFLRDHMLMGETALEMIVGPQSGVGLFSPIPTTLVQDVELLRGNPLWPDYLVFDQESRLKIVAEDPATGLLDGEVMWWTSWQALLDDVRGDPFLTPILDQLGQYDTVLSNLVDRTALLRYLVWDVTVNGDQGDVDKWIADRGGWHVPPSASMEVHNETIKLEPKTATVGSQEDTNTAGSVLTQVAGGAGLAKTWLAEPDGANRATSQSMAEPVRRRVGGVQRMWLQYMTELVRFQVDRAVAARRLPAMVEARDPTTGAQFLVPASQTVTVTGPAISASDAEFTAKVLLNLSTGLDNLVQAEILSPRAARIAARRAWEDYVGVPYTADLDSPETDPGDVATAVADARGDTAVLV